VLCGGVCYIVTLLCIAHTLRQMWYVILDGSYNNLPPTLHATLVYDDTDTAMNTAAREEFYSYIHEY
jgi:hypothetical protein